MTNQPPLNPDALEAAARATYEMRNPESWAHSWEELDPEEREEEWIKPARTVATAYLAVAQPEVNNVEELDALTVGSVVRGGKADLVAEALELFNVNKGTELDDWKYADRSVVSSWVRVARKAREMRAEK